MFFERIKSEGLAHNSYFIGSGDDAVVIDPRRDCQVYLDLARRHGFRIRHILETHRNEDYVVGSLELSKLTGAPIYHGPGLPWDYGEALRDGHRFMAGRLAFNAVHTPGHTDESMSYWVADLASGEAPVMVFTGDTLFVDEVGRTDLYGAQEAPRLASALYDSIFNKLLPLGDGVILCPAHGGGSVCGVNINDRDQSTLGIERAQNPMLQLGSRESFIARKVAEQPQRPPYFDRMEEYNLHGPPALGTLPQPSMLTPSEFKTQMENGAVAVDIRMPASFGGGHIAGSYNIWMEGLPGFAGWLLPYDRPLLLVLNREGQLETCVRYLVRLGFDNLGGYVKNGIEGWYDAGLPLEHLGLLSVDELKGMIDSGEKLTLLDVRDDLEYQAGHIEGAMHIYVGRLEQRAAEVPGDRPIAVYCSVGNRASIAASILQRAGIMDVYNVLGSMDAWKAAGYPVSTEQESQVG